MYSLIGFQNKFRRWSLKCANNRNCGYFRTYGGQVSHLLIDLSSLTFVSADSATLMWLPPENFWNEMWWWKNHEIGVAVQSWLWVRVNSWPDSSIRWSIWTEFSGLYKYWPSKSNFIKENKKPFKAIKNTTTHKNLLQMYITGRL